MATAVVPVPRKRRSSERDRESDTRKRRKEERSKHSRSSKSHSKSDRSPSRKWSKHTPNATPSGLRVRSVTELAALVASGAIRVPKGLQHYVADRTELLDQVFTILSPADVRGMLPDVLKGLKMRQVKQLCLLKLQSMTEEDIHSTVQSDDPTLESNLNNTLMQLLGHTVPSEDKNKSGVVNESRVDGASFSESTKIDEDTSKQNVDVKKGNDSVSECETESSHLCGDKQIDEDEKEIVICVSDVSDDEHGGEKKQSKSKCENVSTNVIDDDVYLVSQHSSQAPQENDLGSNFNNSPGQSTNCLNLTPDVTNRSVSSGESSDSEKDEETEDISEAGQILEMEMRRRALESALKRVNDPIVDQKSLSVASELLDNDSRQSGGLCLEPRADMSDVSIYRTEVGLEKDMNKTSSEAECITETSGSHSVPIQRQTEEETVTHVVPLCDQEQPTECLESESCELDGVGLMIEKRLREKLLQSLSKRK